MNKALIITSVASAVDQFLLPNIYLLQHMGYEVHVACNFEKGNNCSLERVEEFKNILKSNNISFYHINFPRSPLNIDNIEAYKDLKNIVKKGNYNIVHCHTPNASVITRLVCKKFRKKSNLKVFYTAHGFHFYKKAPLKNWLLYYPIEKFCSYYTDVLITINKEDYLFAKKKMKANHVEYIPGVGIDLERFVNVQIDKFAKKNELGIPENAFLILSVGELNDNKNHQIIIKSLAKLKNSNLHYAIAGVGNRKDYLLNLANELGIKDQVHLLGYRKDIPELNHIADIFCFPSIREGLGLAPIEALASGVPIIATDNRGTNEYVIHGENGFLCKFDDVDSFVKYLSYLIEDNSLRKKFGEYAPISVKRFHVDNTLKIMKKIYEKTILDRNKTRNY